MNYKSYLRKICQILKTILCFLKIRIKNSVLQIRVRMSFKMIFSLTLQTSVSRDGSKLRLIFRGPVGYRSEQRSVVRAMRNTICALIEEAIESPRTSTVIGTTGWNYGACRRSAHRFDSPGMVSLLKVNYLRLGSLAHRDSRSIGDYHSETMTSRCVLSRNCQV